MKRFFLAAVLLGFFLPTACLAAEIKYYPDPVYKKLAPEDSYPMEEVMKLAEAGDTRAQFIVGDLYAKEKGGLPKDLDKAKEWFEKAALHGNTQAYLRLAALAKHTDKPLEAWQWYTLALDSLGGDAERFAARARSALIEETHMTSDDMRQARAALNEWKKMRQETLRAEKASIKKDASSFITQSESQHFTGTPNRGAYNE